MDSSGNLYGTTADMEGAIRMTARFSSWPSGSGTITTLASFNGTNGADPFAGLIMDSSGNLYGTTDCGWRRQRRHGFRAGPGQRHDHHAGLVQRRRAINPEAALIMDSSGNLYGTTLERSRYCWRHGFRAGPRQRHDHHAGFVLNSNHGGGPLGGLVMDSSGNLYGTTSQWPAPTTDGTVFELAQGSGTITTLASFSGATVPTRTPA